MYIFLFIAVILIVRFANGPKNPLAAKTTKRKLQVIFLHPDLGIGGAERLIVDAAVGLQQFKAKNVAVDVIVYTNHHEPNRSFKETHDGTLDVQVLGSWIPRHIKNKGHVLFATVRMMYAALILCLFGPKCDVYVVDQVAAAMPILRLLSSRPVYFYCHHPDQLCDPSRIGKTQEQLAKRSLVHRLYRTAFDTFETITMYAASHVVYNSGFTKQVSVATFPFLKNQLPLVKSGKNANAKDDEAVEDDEILYPPINIPRLTKAPTADALKEISPELQQLIDKKSRLVVSINRYERKKNINLAVEAFAKVLKTACLDSDEQPLWLIIAGGYDKRLPENVEHHLELKALAEKLGVVHRVLFLRSFSDAEKHVMLTHAACVVYTPEGEHFGIVPIEAMIFKRPVLAVASGGPLESIGRSDKFGILREPTPEAFATGLLLLLKDSGVRAAIGAAANERANKFFGLDAFVLKMATHLLSITKY